MNEVRICNVCGEAWADTGEQECPFCGSADTYTEDEEEAEEATHDPASAA